MQQPTTITTGLRVGPLRRVLGRAFALVYGWKAVCHIPPTTRRAVVIAAPHTSNWDGVFLVALTWALGVRLSWMLKKKAFRWPFRTALRWLGAVPVDRAAPGGLVDSVAGQIARAEGMYLAMAPEGTRKKTDYWKSGFYRIALAAEVPLVFGFLDYGRKIGGMSEPFHPTGDIAADMDHIRSFYTDIVGCIPEKAGPVRLRTEDESSDANGDYSPGLENSLPTKHGS